MSLRPTLDLLKSKQLISTILLYLLILWGCVCPFNSYSLIQQTKQWTEFKFNGSFFDISKLIYIFETSSRSLLDPTEFEHQIIRAGVGYQYSQDFSFWLGYQW